MAAEIILGPGRKAIPEMSQHENFFSTRKVKSLPSLAQIKKITPETASFDGSTLRLQKADTRCDEPSATPVWTWQKVPDSHGVRLRRRRFVT